MNDDIITTGIQSDRYLKARQLAHDFESTLLDTLETTGHEMLRSGGYATDVTFSNKALGPEHTATLATIRTEVPLKHADIPDTNTKLNVGVEWVTPDTIDDAPADDDAYAYVQYKLQHGSQGVYDTVRNATTTDDSWPDIRFYDDQWYSPQKHAPGIVAMPLTDSKDINDHLTTLQHHFIDVYAPTQRQR